MGISVRRYLLPETAEPRRISNRLANGLIFGEDAIPEYAGTRQKILTVYIDNEEGKPQQVRGADGSVWVFDDEGKIREGLLEALRLAMDSMPLPEKDDATVVNITGKLQRKRLERQYRWEPTAHDIDRVLKDIWPAKDDKQFKMEKGEKPVRPAMTWQATEAMRKVQSQFFEIDHAVDRLPERSLPGFAFEARSRSEDDPDFGPIYRAVAEMAELRLEIMRRRRRNKGIWYARLSITMWGTDHIGEEVGSHFERCESRKAAVAAARRLLVEHAPKFDETTTVDAELFTELEWESQHIGMRGD
ncbi:hypothetical protein ACSBOB_00935 [Mesorhizobium sp. ASY16-5R]|uniref:hypothetical protein n=1 Tax=Mesorhizobium sp. ASY16-5R TaxID=3445772 RepID=UPI003FA101D7